jgi:hypothetical protein
VLGVAARVLGLSCSGIYSSDGVRKARDRETRLAEARANGGVDAPLRGLIPSLSPSCQNAYFSDVPKTPLVLPICVHFPCR